MDGRQMWPSNLRRADALLCALAPLWIALGSGCPHKDDTSDKPTDTAGPPGPAFFVFNPSVAATGYAATVAPEAIDVHRASSMLLASTGVVVADEKVQDRLTVDGAGGVDFRANALRCWERPEFPMFSFSIDYTGCSAYNMAGGVFVTDHASGPLLFVFEDFNIAKGSTDRTVGGTLALDTRGAYPQPLYWQAYNTDQSNPSLDNPVQIGVDIDRSLHGLSYSGGMSIDYDQQEWSTWGIATIGVGEDALTVVHGGRLPDDVAPDEPSGADVLKTPLNWLSCRCPTSGIEALDMPLEFTSVTVDVDDLEDVPDDIDDPEMSIPVSFELFGQGVLTHTGCGAYDVEYQTQAVEIPLSVDQLVGSVSYLCATFAVPDQQRCAAMVAAAANLGGDLKVQISQEDATATALAAVQADFDTSWCSVY